MRRVTPPEACGTLAERLKQKRLIVCRREDKPLPETSTSGEAAAAPAGEGVVGA